MARQASFLPVQSSRLYEEVASQIRARVMNGDLRPGDRLPSESALTKEFGVSRTVVREAIHHLQTHGLVTVRHGSGVYVCEPSIQTFVEAFSTLLQFAEASVPSLHEVREVLEVEIAGLAAQRRTRGDLDALHSTLVKMETLRDSPYEYMESDLSFHRLLASATQNEVFSLLLQPLSDLLRHSRIKSVMSPGRIEKSVAAHRRIYDAVKACESEESRAAMRLHLTEVRADLETEGDRDDTVEGRVEM